MLIAAVALGALGLLLTASLGLWVADYATGWWRQDDSAEVALGGTMLHTSAQPQLPALTARRGSCGAGDPLPKPTTTATDPRCHVARIRHGVWSRAYPLEAPGIAPSARKHARRAQAGSCAQPSLRPVLARAGEERREATVRAVAIAPKQRQGAVAALG